MTELSNRQIDRLGDRLRISDPTAKDLELLGQVRGLYAGALAEVTRVLVDLGYEPGARLKTVGTLVDKLRRIPEPLSRIQDVAGARVVVEMNREEQDRLVERITARFDHYRVKDRRVDPSFGYRAVRYGFPPDEPDLLIGQQVTRQRVINVVMELAETIDDAEAGRLEVIALEREIASTFGGTPTAELESALARVHLHANEAERVVRSALELLHSGSTMDTLTR
ncbi:MAG TPA: hypothetical protein VEP73_07735 [Actinomycetota bacterium]|nr:hypothetical protein [Actinomycetota bacterium]